VAGLARSSPSMIFQRRAPFLQDLSSGKTPL
jgi:hypothetical protein